MVLQLSGQVEHLFGFVVAAHFGIGNNSIAVAGFEIRGTLLQRLEGLQGQIILTQAGIIDRETIEDLRVISRTSVEKYRNSPKTTPEIALELNANYLVGGSGQKMGDQILLNIQLIDATSDKQLWAERYKREAGDIFELQLEVARSIADEIEAIITPEEAAQIEKIPTQNLEA